MPEIRGIPLKFAEVIKRGDPQRKSGWKFGGTKIMARKTYTHSAYWYAYHKGWTHSEARSLAAQYWDMHTYRPRKRDLFERLMGCEVVIDDTFNPLALAACAMVDVGNGVREACRRWATPGERAKRRAEIARELRVLRRPFYYARETERRRALAAERRKLHRRRTLAPMPTPEALLEAWKRRKESKERMIILGGMLHDLECYVDNCLRFDGVGNVVGRNGGIRGWLKECLPELSPKYKTLMRYKAMAIKLRQATKTVDPKPTEELLREEPKREFIAELLGGDGNTFEGLVAAIEFEIDPATVFAERPRSEGGAKNRVAGGVAKKRVAGGGSKKRGAGGGVKKAKSGGSAINRGAGGADGDPRLGRSVAKRGVSGSGNGGGELKAPSERSRGRGRRE